MFYHLKHLLIESFQNLLLIKSHLFQVNGIKYDDSVFGVDLHTIRTNSIKKADYNVEDILPKRIIEKCKALNIWHKQMMLI